MALSRISRSLPDVEPERNVRLRFEDTVQQSLPFCSKGGSKRFSAYRTLMLLDLCSGRSWLVIAFCEFLFPSLVKILDVSSDVNKISQLFSAPQQRWGTSGSLFPTRT